MGLFDFIKNISNNINSDEYLHFSNANKCMIKFKLTETEMVVFGFHYIWGSTSYRMFFRDVIKQNMSKFNKLIKEIKNKSKKECYYDDVYIRFYSNKQFYIDLPLNVFSQKRSINKSERDKKLWHKNNLIRLMNYNNAFKDEIMN
jgi:hypothetical protein